MKNLFIYYFTILAPLGALLWLNRTDAINGVQFFWSILFYAIVFRTYVDGKRLAAKNIILQKDIWKMLIPGKHFQHFRELYLK